MGLSERPLSRRRRKDPSERKNPRVAFAGKNNEAARAFSAPLCYTECMEFQGFAPIYDARSQILILGSFPSVRSREEGFYYGHPQNRFWPVLAQVLGCAVPKSIEEKKQLLLSRRIALWDVAQTCEVTGSADASIKNAAPNDVARLAAACGIGRIYCNGNTAYALLKKFFPTLAAQAVKLPSTSAANAAWSKERLIRAWSVLTQAP